MKFTIQKNLIDSVVDFMNNYIDSNNAFIPYRCLYFSLDSEFLTIQAQSGNIQAQKQIPIDEDKIKIDSKGKFLINASILKNIIKKFNNNVTFLVKDTTVDIYEGATKFTLTRVDIDQYPHIKFSDHDNRTEVKSIDLERVIYNASIAASTSSDKITATVHKCINVSSDDENNIRFVATDSYRLSTESIKVSKPVSLNLTIDAKNLKKLVTKDADKKVMLFFNSSKLGISYTNTIIQIRSTDLNYMNVWNLFKFDISRTIKVDKQEILRLINKALFVTSDKELRLEFTFDSNEIKVRYEVPEIGIGEASTSSCQLDGEKLEIDINYQFIKDAISVLDNGLIKIEVSRNEDRLLITSENNPFNKQLITPIRRF
ncbi:DNA polymerase III subunit beta [Mycoplasmopsis sturni]|uniref:DNA polymerase III subunit beta n=1 Tax=Mycoplasmopsis sturni TaxID=39047 RepID=UPI000567D76F|nr:DNA polymerase III subunit beta [Mycoplasmopsis sturni]